MPAGRSKAYLPFVDRCNPLARASRTGQWFLTLAQPQLPAEALTRDDTVQNTKQGGKFRVRFGSAQHVVGRIRRRAHRQRQRLLEADTLDLLLRLSQLPPQVRVIWCELCCLPEVPGCQLELAKQEICIAAPVKGLPGDTGFRKQSVRSRRRERHDLVAMTIA